MDMGQERARGSIPDPRDANALRQYNLSLSHRIIPAHEFTVKGIRSSGPGGQNVNKVSSAAELRFAVNQSRVLDAAEKALLIERLQGTGRLNGETAEIVLTSSTHRDFQRNKDEVVEKLQNVVRETLEQTIPRSERKKGRGLKTRERNNREHDQQRNKSRREGRRHGGEW